MFSKMRCRQVVIPSITAQIVTLSLPLFAMTASPVQAADKAPQTVVQNAAVPADPSYSVQSNQGMDLPGFEWSLPCEGRLVPTNTLKASGGMLRGNVTTYDVDGDFGSLIDTMLDGALASTNKMDHLNKSVARYRLPQQQKMERYKDNANYILPYRGNATSSEAADVILDEKIKIHSAASAEYARQRYVDQIHPQVVAKTMQLSMAMGLQDPNRRAEAVDNAMAALTKLVGKPGAELALQKVKGWSKQVKVPNALYTTADNWDVEFFQNKLRDVTKLAMDGDPVMKEITARIQKYNHVSMASRASQKGVVAGLNLASWATPGLIIPLAIQAVNTAFTQSTGGSEESKLIKEMYLDKRVESRYRTVNEEAQMALTQYQNALNSHNPTLLICCESVLAQLVGSENIQDVLGGRTLLTHRVSGTHGIETAQNRGRQVQ